MFTAYSTQGQLKPRLILAEGFWDGLIQAAAYLGRESVRVNALKPASYPDVSLLMKMCAQRKAGRRQRARRLADLVFKMAARAMADKYAVFKISSALFILRILSKSLPIHVVCIKRKLLSPHTLDSSIIMFTNELHNVY